MVSDAGSGRSQLLAALGDIAERHPRHHAHVVTVRCSQLAGGVRACPHPSSPGPVLNTICVTTSCCRCRSAPGASHSAVTAALSAAAAEALQCAPSLLLLDDLDAVCRSSPVGPHTCIHYYTPLACWLLLLDDLQPGG